MEATHPVPASPGMNVSEISRFVHDNVAAYWPQPKVFHFLKTHSVTAEWSRGRFMKRLKPRKTTAVVEYWSPTEKLVLTFVRDSGGPYIPQKGTRAQLEAILHQK